MSRTKTILTVVATAAALSTAACGSPAPAPRATTAAKTSASSPVTSDQQAQAALDALIGVKADDGSTVTAVSVVPGSEVNGKDGGYTVKADVTYSDGSVYRDTATDRDGSLTANADYEEKNPTAPPASPSPSLPAPTMTKQTDVIVFKVWGTGEPSVQYGTDSSTNNPSGGAGPLGDGNYLPWQASMPYDSTALYYAVTAQLEGSGSIHDSVTEVVTTWCSGSKPKTESFQLANGSASGGYGIARAEYTGGDTGNATQAESDAGC